MAVGQRFKAVFGLSEDEYVEKEMILHLEIRALVSFSLGCSRTAATLLVNLSLVKN